MTDDSRVVREVTVKDDDVGVLVLVTQGRAGGRIQRRTREELEIAARDHEDRLRRNGERYVRAVRKRQHPRLIAVAYSRTGPFGTVTDLNIPTADTN